MSILSIIFLIISLFSTLYSMSFSVNNNYRGYNLIYASGKIHHEDLATLQYSYKRVSKSRQTILVLNSVGGELNEGLKIGRFLKEHRIASAVRKNGVCVSSCALAFLGGRSLSGSKLMILPRGSKLGFHSFHYRNRRYVTASRIQADLANLMSYIDYVNAPRSLVTKMLKTDANSVYWIPNYERRSLGLLSALDRLSFRSHYRKTNNRVSQQFNTSPKRPSGYPLTQTDYIRYYFSKINAILSADRNAYYSDNIALNDISGNSWLKHNLKYVFIKYIKLLSANQVESKVIYALQNGQRICTYNRYRLYQSNNSWKIESKRYKACSHSSRKALRKFASLLP